jgi:integrase
MSSNQDTTAVDMRDDGHAPSEELAIQVRAPEETRMLLLSLETELVSELASAADSFVRQNRFTQRQERKAWNTVRKEIAALSNFMAFLRTAGVDLSFHLGEEPRLWSAITFGLVESFLMWERRRGYAITTLNDHLDVIKLYAKLAHQAGFQTADQLLAIQSISRIRGAEGSRIDTAREQQAIPTRIGHKKAEPTFLERKDEYQLLLDRPDTPQGWRDRVAILLMYDLSLRPSEVVSLKVRDVDMEEGTINITRHKTHDRQKARLTQRLHLALTRYLGRRQDRSPDAPLLVRTRKNAALVELIPREAPAIEAARGGGRRPYSRNRALYVKLQPGDPAGKRHQQHEAEEEALWTPPLTTNALAKHLHVLGLDIEQALYGESRKPEERINLTSYDGRHEWTRNAIRGGSDPIAVTKAGGWRGHSAMVARYYGELKIVNEDIVLKR